MFYIALPAFFPTGREDGGARGGGVRMHYVTIISFVSDYDMRKLFCFSDGEKNARTSSLTFLYYYSNNTG